MAQSALSSPSDREFASERRFSFDHQDEVLSTKKPSTCRNTPFSAASFDTNWTAPEISEAQAVQMYPHQNSSVLMVDNSAKPSEASDSISREMLSQDTASRPVIAGAGLHESGPTTPTQSQPLAEVESPLRHPRAPPQPPSMPPAFKFIPATPSGVTPVPERISHMGNYYEVTGEKPPRKPSLLRRALTRRRHSISYPPTAVKPPGLLTRTFSLSRNPRSGAVVNRGNYDMDRKPTYPQETDVPVEENRLHPFWQPQWVENEEELEERDAIYRYPLVDNRPRKSARTLGARMKRTFAILPVRDDDEFLADAADGPDRLTVRRTTSGNLRVVKNRYSIDSLMGGDDWPVSSQMGANGYTAGGYRTGHAAANWYAGEKRRRYSIGSKIEAIQNIPQRLSEKRRERRTQELRAMISAPREVRDGVGEVVRCSNYPRRDGSGGRI